jgi:hypothetical protein
MELRGQGTSEMSVQAGIPEASCGQSSSGKPPEEDQARSLAPALDLHEADLLAQALFQAAAYPEAIAAAAGCLGRAPSCP